MTTLKVTDLERVLRLLSSPKLTREIKDILKVNKARPLLMKWEERGLIAKDWVYAEKIDGNLGWQWLWEVKPSLPTFFCNN